MKYTDDDLSVKANLRSKLSEQSERPEAKAQAELNTNFALQLKQSVSLPESLIGH